MGNILIKWFEKKKIPITLYEGIMPNRGEMRNKILIHLIGKLCLNAFMCKKNSKICMGNVLWSFK
jgi:hypothetical protein